jgi:hypothetical protein
VSAATKRTSPSPAQRRRRAVTVAQRTKFLDALAAGWAVRHAARHSGVDFRRWYELRDKDEEFAHAWGESFEQGTQALEDEARRRAVDGYDEDTFDGEGNLQRRVHRYDGALLQTLLKGRRPEVYRDNAPARLDVNARVQIDADFTPTTLRDVLELVRERAPDVIEGEAVEVVPALTQGDA